MTSAIIVGFFLIGVTNALRCYECGDLDKGQPACVFPAFEGHTRTCSSDEKKCMFHQEMVEGNVHVTRGCAAEKCAGAVQDSHQHMLITKCCDEDLCNDVAKETEVTAPLQCYVCGVESRPPCADYVTPDNTRVRQCPGKCFYTMSTYGGEVKWSRGCMPDGVCVTKKEGSGGKYRHAEGCCMGDYCNAVPNIKPKIPAPGDEDAGNAAEGEGDAEQGDKDKAPSEGTKPVAMVVAWVLLTSTVGLLLAVYR